MVNGISVICFAASYSIAWGLELVSLKFRYGWHRALMLALAVAGLAAHGLYLWNRAAAVPEAPLASVYDWCLVASWALAAIYLVLVTWLRHTAVGLFALPPALLLIAASQFASRTPLGTADASRVWGLLHAGALLLGTVTVCVGFLAGLMYLFQSHRLKRARPPRVGFRLPSLEWLQRINSRSLDISTVLIGLGFVTGVILSRIRHQGQPAYHLWTDPVVVSLAAMVFWLIVAELFRLFYPSARGGRKVAYLTLAAFVFLLLTLVSTTMLDSTHGAPSARASAVGAPTLVEPLP